MSDVSLHDYSPEGLRAHVQAVRSDPRGVPLPLACPVCQAADEAGLFDEEPDVPAP